MIPKRFQFFFVESHFGITIFNSLMPDRIQTTFFYSLIQKIFDRFYRVDEARTRQKGGFGLGLSLAQQIVLALKGTIIVKDNQPKGTIFEVKITGV